MVEADRLEWPFIACVVRCDFTSSGLILSTVSLLHVHLLELLDSIFYQCA